MKALFTAAIVFFVPTQAPARVINDMPFQVQNDRADLVVIARPLKSKKVGDIIDLRIRRAMKIGSGPAPVINGIGIETEFEALSIMKGDKDLKTFSLHHYYLLNPKERLGDGPDLVSFEKWKMHHFLMYLKRDADGKYSAVVGQTDPAYSIFRLTGNSEGGAIHYEPCR